MPKVNDIDIVILGPHAPGRGTPNELVWARAPASKSVS